MVRTCAVLACLVAAGGPGLHSQEMPPSPVGYTEARNHLVRSSLRLPGTVESNVVSRVASEIGGLVVEYPVREGDQVTKGQLLARLNARSLELDVQAAKAQLAEAQARQKLAERNYERAKELFDSKVFSQQQLDDTFFENTAWQSRIDTLKSDIARIDHDIARSAITAPFDGVIIAKHTELGEWLGVGDEVAELMSLADLEVVANVPEQYFRQVRLGGAATVEFEALPGGQIPGQISALIPRADPQARTFPVKIRFSAGDRRIGAGMLARVEIAGLGAGAGAARSATIVPKDAIVRRGPQTFVYVLNGEGSVDPAPVQPGAGVGAWIEVAGPVLPGAKVITRGNERLQPGQRVIGEPVEYALP